MKIIVLVFSIAVLSLANYADQRQLPLQIANASKINAQRQSWIVVGNDAGDLHIYSSHARLIKSLEKAHKSRVIGIEHYEINDVDEYVTIDDQGFIIFWDERFNKTISSVDLNETIINIAIKEERRDNLSFLAVNLGNEIVELSLTNKSEMGRLNTSSVDITFLSVVYLQNNLIATDSTSKLHVFDSSRNLVNQYQSTNGQISLLSSHEHDEHSRQNDAVGVINGSFLIHFDLAIGIDQSLYVSNGQITSINYCRAKRVTGKRQKREKEDIILLGLSSGFLQVRSIYQLHKVYNINSTIIDVACEDDDVVLVDSSNNIHFIELDHFEHRNGGKTSQFAIIFFAVLILACVIYQIRENRKTRKEEAIKKEEERNLGDVELQERMINEADLRS